MTPPNLVLTKMIEKWTIGKKNSPRYDPENDGWVNVFKLRDDSIDNTTIAWCDQQINLMEGQGKKRSMIVNLSDLVGRSDVEQDIAKLAHQTEVHFQVYFAWGFEKNKSLHNKIKSFLGEGFEDNEADSIAAVVKHPWTCALSVQIYNAKKKKQDTVGQVVFAFIKDKEDYKAAYVDYLHVTRRPAKDFGIQGFTSLRGNGIGRLLLRLVLSLGLARSPGSEFDMYLKVPSEKQSWYKSNGFTYCTPRYWKTYPGVLLRDDLVQQDPNKVTKMVLQRGRFIPKTVVQFNDRRKINYKIPDRLEKTSATDDCRWAIGDVHVRKELMKMCPSARNVLRLPLGLVVKHAIIKHPQSFKLKAEAVKMQYLEVWFEQGRRSKTSPRRLRRILFDEPVRVTFFCSACSKRVGIFSQVRFPCWKSFANFVLRDYLKIHFDNTNKFRCDIIGDDRCVDLKKAIRSDYGVDPYVNEGRRCKRCCKGTGIETEGLFKANRTLYW